MSCSSLVLAILALPRTRDLYEPPGLTKNPLSGGPFDPALIAEGQPALSAQDQERIAAFVELHIEQANTLEQDVNDMKFSRLRTPKT